MMKRFLSLLLLLPFTACAASVNTYTLYPTNFAVSGDTITVNGTARTFADATTASTILTNRASLAGLITNVFNAFGQYPMGASVSFGSSTSLVFRGLNLTLATASGATNWAVVVTNLAPSTNFYFVGVPHYNMPGTNVAAVKVNNANYIASYLDTFVTTNAFREAATVVSNLVGRTSTQDVGNKRLTNSTVELSAITNASRMHGTVHVLTNGQYISPTLRSPTMTNGANYGNAFSSPGSGSQSEQFGNGSVAEGVQSFASGFSVSVYGLNGIGIGNTIANYAEGAAVFGANINVDTNSVAALYFGYNGEVVASDAIGIGNNITLTNANSGVINVTASAARSTRENELTLQTSVLYVPSGRLEVAGITNLTVLANSTNNWKGDISFAVRANTSLANGNNAGVLLGTNVYLTLSGPSAAYTIAGFAAERAGAYHVVQLANPAGPITIANESGVDATAANRILTGTGADLSLTNNPSFVQVIYDGAASRWRVITHSR